jgi:hypothetical protein
VILLIWVSASTRAWVGVFNAQKPGSARSGTSKTGME